MEKKNETRKITLPCGQFCGGNCSTCIHWDRSDISSNDPDRRFCNWYDVYYKPSERQGCLSYEAR